MPRYHEVITAAGTTATKIIGLRTGRRKEIIVTTSGKATASVVWNDTDPSVTLNLPTLPPDAILTRAEADRIVGFIAHECCHVIHSDWSSWCKAVGDGDQVKHLTNALEDVRIEA